MYFGFIDDCFATSSSAYVLVAVTLARAGSEAFVILTITSALVIFVASIETGVALHGTTFFDCCNMPKMFSSMKLVPSPMLTASFSRIWNVASDKESPMRTCKSVLPMASIESLEGDQNCTFPAACR